MYQEEQHQAMDLERFARISVPERQKRHHRRQGLRYTGSTQKHHLQQHRSERSAKLEQLHRTIFPRHRVVSLPDLRQARRRQQHELRRLRSWSWRSWYASGRSWRYGWRTPLLTLLNQQKAISISQSYTLSPHGAASKQVLPRVFVSHTHTHAHPLCAVNFHLY